MRSLFTLFGAMLAVALMSSMAGCSSTPGEMTAPIVAQAPEAGIMAIAANGSGTVRVLFARRGSMVLIRDIRLPRGQAVRGMAVSADGRDFVINTDALAYFISMGAWKLQPIGALAQASGRH